MKFALAAIAGLLAGLSFAAPAAAFDDRLFAPPPPVLLPAQNPDWRDRGDWRDRDQNWQRPGRWDNDRDDRLTERQVARNVIRQGYVRIEDIDLRRDRYIVRAVRPNGALVRLAIDAYDGDVIARERIGWVAGDRGPDRDYRRPSSGVEFDLGGGTLGIYSR